MKRIYLLLLLFTGIVNAQIVNIPDANFKAILTNADTTNLSTFDINDNPIVVDINTDGEIQQSEALLVYGLNVSGLGIADLTGLESFTNLKGFGISQGTFTSIPVSSLVNLEGLVISLTALTSLDLSGLNNLKIVNCNNNQITNLTLTASNTLQTLRCYGNFITSLNLQDYTQLTLLSCEVNNLTSLNVQGCTALTSLDCYENNLTTLDVSGLANLTQLNAITNIQDVQLTTINAAGCSALANSQNYNNHNLDTVNFNGCSSLPSLNVLSNHLTSLNISGCSALVDLDAYGNNLTSLDLSGCSSLANISLTLNQLTTLDASDCTSLNNLTLGGNQLVTLLVKNGKNESLTLGGNPNLQFVCADESQIPAVLNQLNAAGITNAVVNTYCSFTPGGNYNTITGAVYLDADNNGCSTADVVPPNIKMTITDGSNTGATFINNNADYRFYTNAGNFTVTPSHEISDYFTFSPASAVVNFPMVDHLVATHNFCMTANGVHPDLEVILAPSLPAVPGFNAIYYIVYKNKGNQTVSGSINLTFDDARTDFIDAVPMVDSQSPNTLSWNFTNLLPFQTRLTSFMLHINSPVETPPVNAGDILDFTVAISDVPGDETPADNSFELHQLVVNAYDPNDKTCLEGTNVLPENIGKYLHYNVNFENTGTADAINIVVKDTIDTTRFDINTLQLLYASHPVNTKITGNVVEFIFENINLPPSIMNPIGGHGNVLFKIKTLPTLTVGDEVSNTANIYFDYNAPIDTNEARTAFNNLSKSDFVKDDSVTVYPNPAKNKVTVKATGTIKSVQLYDVQGRILHTAIEDKNQITLDLSNQQTGIYFLTVTTQKGSSTQKIIKE